MARLVAACVLAGLGLACAAQQPDPQVMAMFDEPRRVLEESKLGAHHEKPHTAVLLSEGAATGATRIIREIGSAERQVEKVMHGHPELLQEERLLHEASEMALRAGQMGTARRAGHKRTALLQQRAAAGARTRVSSKAAAAAEAQALSGIASQESMLIGADQKLLKEAAGVQTAAASSLSGKEASEVSRLLGEVSAAQRKVVSSEKRELTETKTELRGLRGQQRSGSRAMVAASISHEKAYAQKEMSLARDGRHIMSEISEAKKAVDKALGKRGSEVEALLEEAQRKQKEVVHTEVKDVKQSSKRIRELAREARQ